MNVTPVIVTLGFLLVVGDSTAFWVFQVWSQQLCMQLYGWIRSPFTCCSLWKISAIYSGRQCISVRGW